MSAGRVTVRPIGIEHSEPSKRCEQIKSGINAELGQLHKTNALLIAAQFASNHECEFDVSDALAVIRDRVEESIDRLDEAQLSP